LRAEHPGEVIAWQGWRIVATAFVIGPWILFSLGYARGRARPRPLWKHLVLLAVALLPPALALGFRDDLVVAIRPSVFAFQTVLTLGWPALAVHLGLLLGAVIVLSNLERTYRAAVGTIRWRIKFMLLGLGLLFVVRIYTSSQALIVRSADPAHVAVDAAALLAGALVMLRSLVRSGHFEMDVYPSPTVLRSSLTLLLVGIYLVAVGLLSKLSSAIEGLGSLGVTAFVALLAIVVLAVGVQSDRVQLQLRRFVSRHFQRPFYDYRTAWRAFTESTAAQLDQEGLCRALTKQTANLFQAMSVSIWVVPDDGDGLVCVASSALPEASWAAAAPDSAGAGAVLDHFRRDPEPVDFEALAEPWAETLRLSHPRLFPNGGNRAAAPLASRGTIVGLLVIGDRVGGGGYATQDLDMLRCVADHTAASLMSIRLSERLLQSRELEAFQTMAAFFVHDLKNAASTLNLMLPNLPVHWNNPEFREDALRGITKTVSHINTLIRRLGELRHELKLQLREADLNAVVDRATEGWKSVPDVSLVRSQVSLPPLPLDPEQILTVITNLILNARDATLAGPNRPGQVRVETRRDGGWGVVTVADNGCGMSPEFLARSLFRPFQTTKKNGLGIGMFQSKMIVERHGGRLVVESTPGRGTTFSVLLPLGPGGAAPAAAGG
jgi:putative PEP-CTERM system histidine kinase